MPKKTNRTQPSAKAPTKWQTLTFWSELDKHSRELEGKKARERAIEWFYYESLKRAYADQFAAFYGLSRSAQTQLLKQDSLIRDLLCVRNDEHHWLIECGPKPSGLHKILHYYHPALKHALAVTEFNGRAEAGLFHLSIDPGQPKNIIVRQVKKKLESYRASGQGRKYALETMWQALQILDQKKTDPNAQIKSLGHSCPDFKNMEIKTIRDRLDLAKKMLELARAGPAPFVSTFLQLRGI